MADTALDLVTDCLKDLGVVAAGETAEPAQVEDGLRALNDLLDAWSAERLTVYRVAQINHAFVVSKSSYTIGTAGGEDINQARPTAILDGSFVRDANNFDYPLIVMGNRIEYDRIATKSTETIYPHWVFYDPAYPSGTLFYWQVPNTALTAFLNVPAALTQFTDSNDTITFPPGYRRALRMNGAEFMQDMFGAQLSQSYLMRTREAKATIKRNNLVGRQRRVRVPRKLRRSGYTPSAADTRSGEYL